MMRPIAYGSLAFLALGIVVIGISTHSPVTIAVGLVLTGFSLDRMDIE